MAKSIKLIVLFFSEFALFGVNSGQAHADSIGIYGTVVLGTPSQYDYVDNGTIDIYEKIDGQWEYVTSVTTSACGYYTYETGHRGEFKVVIDTTSQTIRVNESGCSNNTYIENSVVGSNSGTIWSWQSWKVLDIFAS